MEYLSKLVCIFSLFCHFVEAWIHNIKLQDDDRPRISVTHPFGFLKDGTMAVNMTMFSIKGAGDNSISSEDFGFSLVKSGSFWSFKDGMYSYGFRKVIYEDSSVVFFELDIKNKQLIVELGVKDLQDLTVVATPWGQYLYENSLAHREVPVETSQENTKTSEGQVKTVPLIMKDTAVRTEGQKYDKADTKESEFHSKRKKHEDALSAENVSDKKKETPLIIVPGKKKEAIQETQRAKVLYLPLTSRTQGNVVVYEAYFLVHIKTKQEEGLYNLFFHNCRYRKCHVNLTAQIIQDNNGNYLSAGEIPIPATYFFFSLVYLILTVVWFSALHKAKEGVYKIHFLMLVVLFLRFLSDFFHAVHIHMIQQSGIRVDTWAILWYIFYIMQGALMHVTVLLIGAGWGFIKNTFSNREKKLFIISIPLQILVNIAWMTKQESEDWYSSYGISIIIFVGIDLLWFFPVIWSIRFLQEASKTDWKNAVIRKKLKLYIYFYILLVAYSYLTRIAGSLIQITLPFKYVWMKDLWEEVVFLMFFFLTGEIFQPKMTTASCRRHKMMLTS